MKICTWNINSVRLRAPLVRRLMESHAPDVICLQETKTPDEHFPFEAFREMGYAHIHIAGMKSYNGVCIISKLPFESTEIYNRVGKDDCRHISVQIAKGQAQPVDIHCIYIPAGGDVADRDVNEKFGHKIDFVDELTAFFATNYTKDQSVVAMGDFNIAPREHDVWSHKQLLKVVSHTPIEVEKLGAMQESLDWVDASREFVPDEEKCYTWWSYRNRDWRKSNRGRRLDHIWVTPPLKDQLVGHEILSDARDWEKPSDHAPLFIDLK